MLCTCSHTHHLPLVLGDEIHLVDEAEDLGVGGVLEDGLQAGLVVVHVLLHLPTLNVKDIDENLGGGRGEEVEESLTRLRNRSTNCKQHGTPQHIPHMI